MWSANPNGTVNSKTAKQVYSFTHFDLWQVRHQLLHHLAVQVGSQRSGQPVLQRRHRRESVRRHRSGQLRGRQRNLRPVPLDRRLERALRHQDVHASGRCTTSRSKSAWMPTPRTATSPPPSATSSAVCSSRSTCPTRATSTSLPWCTGSSTTTTPSPSAAAASTGPTPGVTCLTDGNTSFKPTWAVETNYYMDLGFLPREHAVLLDQRPRRLVRQEGHGHRTAAVQPGQRRVQHRGRVQLRADPSDLDASKAIWGAKYSHFVDVWVAYRYWQNKFGLDHSHGIRLHQRRRRPSEQRLVHGILGLRRHHREVLIT